MGKDELLHYLNESMRAAPGPSRTGAQPAGGSAYSYSYSYRDKSRRQAAAAPKPAPAAAKRAKKAGVRWISRGRWALFCCALPFFLAAFVCAVVFLAELLRTSVDLPLIITALALCVPGGVLYGLFRRRSRKEKDYSRTLTAVGGAPFVSVEKLAGIAHVGYAQALRDADDMAVRGYFGPAAYVDFTRGLLIVDPARTPADAAETAAPEKVQPEKSAPEQAAAAEKAAPSPASDPYETMLQELRALNERIEDEAMSDRIYRIEAVARATFLAVKEKPEKQPQIRRFMDYYLPTTIKLLNAYAGFEKQDVSGENIRRSKESIEKMTETLSAAFEKQFDSLFLAETMDINAEIRTMDSLLRQDGYIGGMTMPGN